MSQQGSNSKSSTACSGGSVQMDLQYGLEQLIGLDENGFNQQGRDLYTWTGVLQFLNEYQRISKLKQAEWDLEKQQLHNRANFLQQQLAAQEILNKDLIKRVKMLQYALRQERISYSKKFDPFPFNKQKSKEQQQVAQKQDQCQNTLINDKVRDKLQSMGLYPFDSPVMNSVMLAKISQRQAKSRKPLIAKFLEEVGYADIFEQHQQQKQQQQQQQKGIGLLPNEDDDSNQYSLVHFNGQQGFQVKKQQQGGQQQLQQQSQKHIGLFSRNITPNSNTPPTNATTATQQSSSNQQQQRLKTENQIQKLV